VCVCVCHKLREYFVLSFVTPIRLVQLKNKACSPELDVALKRQLGHSYVTEEVRMCGLKCWLCLVSRCAGLQPVSVILVSCRTSPAMLDSSGVDCRTPRRITLRHKKWKYRGEGNANLVLALTQVGVIVFHFDGTVLLICGNGWLITRRPCSMPCLLERSLPVYTSSSFTSSNFGFNALWPAVLYFANPQHTQTGSNSSTIAADSSNGVTNTSCCRYSCMRSWWWVEVPSETCRAVSRYK
jgi:hypothetical protein